MSWVRKLARPEITALDACVPGPRPEAVLLDANEVWEDTAGNAHGLNRYPAPMNGICARLAPRYGVTPAQILLARGSDDGIDALTRAFCRAGHDAVQVMPPTFPMYTLAARIQGAEVISTPRSLPDFELDVAQVLEDWRPAAKLVFVCTPNNPTGNEVAGQDIQRLCRALAGKALVVVDEAYGEFSGAQSAAHYLDEYPNLVVLRTLSKAWALAAERCGVLLAHHEVINLTRQVLPPYPLAASSLVAAAQSMEANAQSRMQMRISHVAAERARLTQAFASLPAARRVYPSAANFLLVKFVTAAGVHRALLAAGVRVRDFKATEAGLENCLRITIGSTAENDRLLAVLKEFEGTCA